MKRIDSHQHFWEFDPVRDIWINDEMKVIQRNFFPEDLQLLLQQNDFDGCVAVQSDQSEAENHFHLQNAEKYDFIKGIVGWINLQAEDVEGRLLCYSRFKKLKGFRHVLQGESQRDLMLQPAFMKGISLLNRFNFTYDILIFKDQLQYVHKFVSAFPNQPFVIDHIAKPDIKYADIDQWKEDIRQLAKNQNVYCKISGLVTEADWKNWKKEDFKPYLEVVVDTFGMDRVMFGSDWPVCLVAASYSEMLGIVEDYFSSFSVEEQENFFGLNAIRFYNL